MPYVKPEIAAGLDAGLLQPTTAGELTYLLTKSVQAYLDYFQDSAAGYRYEQLAVCLGALEGAKADLIRRIVTPYEELAQSINGDVWPRHLQIGQGDERNEGDS